MRPDDALDACADAHRTLLATVAGLTDDLARGPSRLDGWTRGHLVTHLARNADSHTGMLDGAAHGEERQQYPSMAARAAGIDAGAHRPAATLVADLAEACDRLERAWATLPDPAWDRHGLRGDERTPMHELPVLRLREVWVHLVDLDLGVTPGDWPPTYVEVELARRLPGLADRADHATLVAWLLGRGPAPDLGPW